MTGVSHGTIKALRSAATSASALLAEALTGGLRGDVALVSSFGAESVLLLALAAEIDPSIPVLFLDTGKHFPETLAYRDTVIETLRLSDVRNIAPRPSQIEQRDPQGQLWAFDADACCALRKVEPLDEAVIPFQAWITGRKRGQSAIRQALELIEVQPDGRVKLNPLAQWSAREIDAEMTARNLPRHPLVELGYASIGCAPCTSTVMGHEDPRAGRWAGIAKTECGIHRVA